MKTFHIKELDTFHPALLRFLAKRNGDRATGMEVLMAIEASKWFSRQDKSVKESHMNVVDQIRGIAKTVRRPQRVPTYWEWMFFVKGVRDGACRSAKGKALVQNPDSQRFLEAIVAHEAAAKANRIFARDARAAAR